MAYESKARHRRGKRWPAMCHLQAYASLLHTSLASMRWQIQDNLSVKENVVMQVVHIMGADGSSGVAVKCKGRQWPAQAKRQVVM